MDEKNKKFQRLVIIGGPSTGKTTLADSIGGLVKCTDDLMHLEWSASSEACSHWFDGDYDVIEGVTTVRALRKWLQRNPTGKPCDHIIYLTKPYTELTNRQMGLTKSILTIFSGIAKELQSRGVKVEIK